MKIKLQKTGECCDCGAEDQWIESGDIEVEVPDAIVTEWRACWDRIAEIEEYFDERVQPEIDEAHRIRREQWRREHPEEAARQDVWAQMLLKNMEQQAAWFQRWTGTLSLLQDDVTKAPAEAIKYDESKKSRS